LIGISGFLPDDSSSRHTGICYFFLGLLRIDIRVCLSGVCDEFHSGPNFRDNERCSSLPDCDVQVVLEYSEDAPNIVGGIVKVK
jgi:hypothetical protein